ncbi:MAG TPA: response regulator [Burkholderiales bacterium]|nr:response regulator [Burkholderiales bacterium]
MSTSQRVLVVDDDPAIRDLITEYLSTHGYEVAQAESGEAMRAALAAALPDVILLDINMPKEDGLTLARHLRERYDVGIIMVTGASDVVDRVVGLEVGADDYLTKPFDPRELRARVRSVLRRLQARPAEGAQVGAMPKRLQIGRCSLDLDTHQLFAAEGGEIPITTMEFDLLRVFAEHPNQVLTRDRLLTLTRNREWEPFDRSIDIRIARLRKKIEDSAENPQFIRTVRGAGYMFVPSRGDG